MILKFQTVRLKRDQTGHAMTVDAASNVKLYFSTEHLLVALNTAEVILAG